jgi:hypothetical protein
MISPKGRWRNTLFTVPIPEELTPLEQAQVLVEVACVAMGIHRDDEFVANIVSQLRIKQYEQLEDI